MLHSNHLKQLDLQDIVLFLNLLELRSAKRTAERMSVSPPTISYGLKRLRGCFDDALFVSLQGLLQPTPKAERIAPYLRMVVDSVNRCAEEEAAASTQALREIWRLCSPEYFELLFLPQTLASLSNTHANVSLHLERLGRDLPVDRLISGDMDLAIGFGPGYHRLHPELQWQPLLSEGFTCLVHREVFGSRAALGLDEFCAIPHAFPTPWISEKNMVDRWLETVGRSRDVLVSVNGYQACISIVATMPAITTLPTRLLTLLRVPPEVIAYPPPLGFPSFTLDMIWASGQRERSSVFRLRTLLEGLAVRLGPMA